MKADEKLSQVFNIAPMETTPAVIQPPVISTENDARDDYEKTRETLYDLIDKGSDVLDHMVELAKGSEHPRAYEVAGQLIKTVADTTKELMKLQKSMKELDKSKKQEEQAPTQIGQQTNIVFNGSTADLLKEIRRANEKIIDNEAN